MCSRMLLKVMHSRIKNVIALNHLSKNNLYLNYTFKYLSIYQQHYVVGNFLSQVLFVFLLFLGMVNAC